MLVISVLEADLSVVLNLEENLRGRGLLPVSIGQREEVLVFGLRSVDIVWVNEPRALNATFTENGLRQSALYSIEVLKPNVVTHHCSHGLLLLKRGLGNHISVETFCSIPCESICLELNIDDVVFLGQKNVKIAGFARAEPLLTESVNSDHLRDVDYPIESFWLDTGWRSTYDLGLLTIAASAKSLRSRWVFHWKSISG